MIKRIVCAALALFLIGCGKEKEATAEAKPAESGIASARGRARCQRSGIPVVLNTSFNENEPIVCTPEEAIACYLRTRMDVLVIGDFVARKGTGVGAAPA